MTNSQLWLSLTDLGRMYGISAIHCGRALNLNGLRDQKGKPTQEAIQAGAAYTTGANKYSC